MQLGVKHLVISHKLTNIAITIYMPNFFIVVIASGYSTEHTNGVC